MLSDLLVRLRALFRRNTVERELDEELRFHLDQEVAAYVKTGLTQEEALRRARMTFGGLDQVKEECREARGVWLLETAVQDLRYSLRGMRRRPGFTAVALFTLATGIGGATAIFGIADAVILRPLPFPEPDRLVLLWQRDLKANQPVVAISYPAYKDWRDQNRVFEELAGMPEINWGWTLTGRGEPVELVGRLVTANFFAVMGQQPLLGRTLAPEDDRIGATPVVVLSHALWRDQFSQDPAIVGQTLVLNGQSHTVVGVMPKGFAYPPRAQLWMPLVPGAGATTVESGGLQWMIALGRVKPKVSLDIAREDMNTLLGRYLRDLVERLPPQFKDVLDPEGYAVVITPLSDALFGPTRPALLALLGAVVLVLLIACANVAGLLLVRTTERRQEMAVRLALGASPGRLARGLFSDSLLLAVLGGSTGLLAAKIGVPLLVRLSPEDVPRLQDATVDIRVFAFALVASGATAVLSGLAPMLVVRKTSLDKTLRQGSRSVAPGRSRPRSALVVSEVAIALVLLVGAGLLARSFVALRRVPLGFQPEHVLSVNAYALEARYPDAHHWRVFYQELLRRVQALPGVESAATVSVRPLSGPTGWDFPFTVEGQSEAEARRNPAVNLEAVSAGYFRTTGIAVKRGRVFTEADVEGQPGVVVVSESLARRSWPGQDPIGKRLKVPQWKSPYSNVWLSVVGVVGDAHYRELQASRLDLYMSYLQGDHRTGSLMVRTRQEPTALAGAVREAVWSMDRDKAPPAVTTMTSVVSEALAMPRFATGVFGAFALVGLLLAALGLYGLLAYLVTSRTREIGLRMAVGALPRDLQYLVLREGLGLTVGGLALGLLAALASTRLLESLLYGVRATDALTFAAVAVVLLAVAVLACSLPLRRALGVDPVAALRHE
jgi:putative ABC transport system permease protein